MGPRVLSLGRTSVISVASLAIEKSLWAHDCPSASDACSSRCFARRAHSESFPPDRRDTCFAIKERGLLESKLGRLLESKGLALSTHFLCEGGVDSGVTDDPSCRGSGSSRGSEASSRGVAMSGSDALRGVGSDTPEARHSSCLGGVIAALALAGTAETEGAAGGAGGGAVPAGSAGVGSDARRGDPPMTPASQPGKAALADLGAAGVIGVIGVIGAIGVIGGGALVAAVGSERAGAWLGADSCPAARGSAAAFPAVLRGPGEKRRRPTDGEPMPTSGE